MSFDLSGEDSYSYIDDNSYNSPHLNSSSEHILKKLFKRNIYIFPHLPTFSEDEEDIITSNNNLSNVRFIFPFLRKNQEISSSKENMEKINILNNIDSCAGGVVTSNEVLCIELSSEKSTGNKTKKKQEQIFKITKLKKGIRYTKKDNILAKIIRHFFNNYLVNEITNIIKDLGSKLYFDKFPQNFILKAVKKNNKTNIWKMKLIEIFLDEELYTKEDKINYARNKDVIEHLKSEKYKNILEDSKFNIILNETISDIYNEYLVSNEYEQKIKSLEGKYGKEYIDKFNKYAKNLNQNFSDKNYI